MTTTQSVTLACGCELVVNKQYIRPGEEPDSYEVDERYGHYDKICATHAEIGHA